VQASTLFLTSLLLSVAAGSFAQVTTTPGNLVLGIGLSSSQLPVPQADDGAGTVITLDEALALAERNSPLLKEGNAAVDHARAGIETAKAYTNPSVEFLGGNQAAKPILTPGVPGTLQHYSVSQTIEIPAERRARIRTSSYNLVGSKYRMAGIRLSVLADVKRAFYDVIRRKQQLAYAKDNLTLVEDLRRRVRLEVEVGEKGKLELTRAEAELARANVAVRSADVELANARAILKAVIGASSDEAFDAKGSLGETVPIPPLNQIREQVLANHPALSEANAVIARSRSVVDHERTLRIPQPTFYGEYEWQPDISFYRVGISVPLPLWDRRKGPIAQAQAGVTSAEASASQRRLEITAALERAFDQYQISNQQVEGLQAGSLREAQAAVEAALSAYKFGERGILEVLDAQRVLQGVRSDLLDAQYARQSALVDLEELGVTHQ